MPAVLYESVDVFTFLIRDDHGVFHGHHCPDADRERRNDWAWWQGTVTCLQCVSGRWKPQTWHIEPKKVRRVVVPASHRLCVPPADAKNVIALHRDGRWYNWDGHTPGVAFVAKHGEGWPIAVYSCSTMQQRWNCRVCNVVSSVCCDLNGCSNGHPVKPLEAT